MIILRKIDDFFLSEHFLLETTGIPKINSFVLNGWKFFPLNFDVFQLFFRFINIKLDFIYIKIYSWARICSFFGGKLEIHISTGKIMNTKISIEIFLIYLPAETVFFVGYIESRENCAKGESNCKYCGSNGTKNNQF